MNRTHYIRVGVLIMVILCVCYGCHPKRNPTQKAALEIYRQYADKDNELTVAYIGNYEAYNHTYTAIILHADSDSLWQWIKGEFGLFDITELTPNIGREDAILYSMIEIEDSLWPQDDSTTLLMLLDSAARQALKQISAITVENAEFIFVNIDSTESNILPSLNKQAAIRSFAKDGGTMGYIIKSDPTEQSICLFFYSDSIEQQALLSQLYIDL